MRQVRASIRRPADLDVRQVAQHGHDDDVAGSAERRDEPDLGDREPAGRQGDRHERKV